jgi:hypothetical protein
MSNPNEFNESAGAGSSTNGADNGAGTPAVSPEQYANLESVVGKQGQELGEYRQFFADVAPLLDKLDKSPELVQAIIDGKIDAELVKASLEGKISYKEATDITKAHTEVKKELGAKEYKSTSADEIAKLVDEKVSSIRKEIQGNLKDAEDIRSFESNVNDFISRTPDFAEYARDIDVWLDNHDITDIEVAYYAVKGQISERDAKKLANQDKAEYEKNIALNAGGGNSRVTYSGAEGASMIDSLVSGKSNPNVF